MNARQWQEDQAHQDAHPYRTPEKPKLMPSKFIGIAAAISDERDLRIIVLDEDGRVWISTNRNPWQLAVKEEDCKRPAQPPIDLPDPV